MCVCVWGKLIKVNSLLILIWNQVVEEEGTIPAQALFPVHHLGIFNRDTKMAVMRSHL